jgi:hypothetical protein
VGFGAAHQTPSSVVDHSTNTYAAPR